ncbi:MAG: hypothetical protein WBN22_06035, partial [Verrucomicrobiia bacterium]
MNELISNEQRGFPVKCDEDAVSKYDEKTVLFKWQREAESVLLIGKFIVHLGVNCFYVDIEYRGILYHFESPNTLG